MSGRSWKDWEIALAKEFILQERAKGVSMTDINNMLSNKLDRRTPAAINWYWNSIISKEEGMAELIGKADRAAMKAKTGQAQAKKQNWYQANVAKVVTLPHQVVTEIERIKAVQPAALYNLMELSTNPILSEYLSKAAHTQLFFKALEVGYKPDKTGDELMMEKMVHYHRQCDVIRYKAVEEALITIGRYDLMEKVRECINQLNNRGQN